MRHHGSDEGRRRYGCAGVLALLAAQVLAAGVGPARAADKARAAVAQTAAPGALTPLGRRVSDEGIARDLRLTEALARRLEAHTSGPSPADPYRASRARALILLTREEYLDNDPTAIADAAYAQAVATVEEVERGTPGLAPALPILAGSKQVRADLWQVVTEVRNSAGLHCAADLLGRLEVELEWAGHEELDCGTCRSNSHIAIAEQLAAAARRLADSCATPPPPPPPPPPVVVVPPPPPPKPVERETTIVSVPNVVHFAYNVSTVGPATSAVLQQVSAMMVKNPGVSLHLVGHTDSRGSVEYNMKLSRKRAEAVRDFLVTAGVEDGRLGIGWEGKSRPLRLAAGVRDFAYNRRVEFVFTVPDTLKVRTGEQDKDLQPDR
ncbi:MAG TPA: OmpA family protein [Actinomycetota bacterium]|nr:OmpA family protein [Actinomycetota bacterium]